MEVMSVLVLVCVCFLNVFQISEADPIGCEKPPRPSCDNTQCTKGVCLGPVGSKKCYPCQCRDDSQCILGSNDKPTCQCGPGLTGDHCECSISAACPGGWLLEGRSCYFFAQGERLTWDAAKDYCESIGLPRVSSLVNVNDEDEYNNIRDYLTGNNGNSWYWIGGRYNDTTADYRWLDGTAVSLNDDFWVPTKPGSIQGCINFAFSNNDWKWNTVDGCATIPGVFICEIEINQ